MSSLVTMVATLVQLGAGVGTFGMIAAGIAMTAVLLSWNVEQLLPNQEEARQIKESSLKK